LIAYTREAMIITTIKIHGRSEKRREIVQTFKGLPEQLIQNEGCLKTNLFQDLDDNDTFYFTKECQTREDLGKFKISKSLAVLLGLETLLVESVEIKHAVKVLTQERWPAGLLKQANT
jgi:quinol monooxygenase YgiN